MRILTCYTRVININYTECYIQSVEKASARIIFRTKRENFKLEWKFMRDMEHPLFEDGQNYSKFNTL